MFKADFQLFSNVTHPVQTLRKPSSRPKKGRLALFVDSIGQRLNRRWRDYLSLKWIQETKKNILSNPDEKRIQIAIRPEKVQQLLANHHLCAADLYPLDPDSKQCVRIMCLHNCIFNNQRSRS